MKVLISQMKPYLGDMEKNLKKMKAAIEEGIKNEGDVIVFPELALNGSLLEDIVFDTGISEIPASLLEFSRKITIIFGAVESCRGKLYNCGYCLEDGKIIEKHRKVFLSNGNGGSESRYFTRGKEIKTFESRHGIFAVILGEEGLNPFVNGILGAEGAEIVFNLINEGTVVKSEKSMYETAAENSCYFNKNFNITVNRVGTEDSVVFEGGSFAVSPYGKIIEKVEKFIEKLSIIDIELKDLKRAAYSSQLDRESNLEIIQKEIERVIKKD